MNSEIRSLPPLERAARLCGGYAELGRRLGGQSRQTLNNWRKRGVPERFHLKIQDVTGGVVKARELGRERHRLRQRADAETA